MGKYRRKRDALNLVIGILGIMCLIALATLVVVNVYGIRVM